jgi:hypothetical protein
MLQTAEILTNSGCQSAVGGAHCSSGYGTENKDYGLKMDILLNKWQLMA